jgi:hypothetical protein
MPDLFDTWPQHVLYRISNGKHTDYLRLLRVHQDGSHWMVLGTHWKRPDEMKWAEIRKNPFAELDEDVREEIARDIYEEVAAQRFDEAVSEILPD